MTSKVLVIYKRPDNNTESGWKNGAKFAPEGAPSDSSLPTAFGLPEDNEVIATIGLNDGGEEGYSTEDGFDEMIEGIWVGESPIEFDADEPAAG